ncbi:tryptophan 7-halogenase [Aestuariibacter sp. GS-14]|uniref:tryptophan halogenase family protein n=1 Tax=Aestuariibacter sp. GS-14 TaxID=2590670 RepID=UPI00112BCFAF|nr:tryptophan halogenase family protein [Aestuariibacter sp. GS-14]TPV57393.1 tryptophan 7-halogenase [Aestuariibacter sp. GS-14]
MMNQTHPASVIIVGGGTAGWMCAAYLAKQWGTSTHITLIESSQIGTVGVGEGSTPFLKQFFADLGWQEQDWMPDCDATYKTGIEFANWTNSARFSQYFHPFFTPLDQHTGELFFNSCQQLRSGLANADVKPEHYFSAAEMVRKRVTPQSSKLPGDIDYAYHFDASKLALRLHSFSMKQGVTHREGKVAEVYTEAGNIRGLRMEQGDVLHADLYVDCSGFIGLLMKKALNAPFKRYRDTLFNNAAVALPTMHGNDDPITPQTRSVGMDSGWMWQIPLTTRIGNGYVYSADFCSADEAEAALRKALNVDDGIPARHLNMEVGRLEQHWQGNCVAIGLAQGFIEPLEATALMLVQYALYQLVDGVGSDKPLARAQQEYNCEMNRMFDGIRDYIAAHYYLNTRTDSAYWTACRHDMVVPDNLQYLLEKWDSGACFETALDHLDSELVYLRPSWYCILAGMGRFNQLDTSQPAPVNRASIAHLEKLVGHYFSHQQRPLSV